ncbi:uncharacterized protein PGTG_20793 [Puccinia graminis f. sp. tritici CRL 75-36-700-3]|uniref:Concentrative nucleoside transporter C-terminal domain-containing protein n=1 Tax=Puccinia graminis f. sp. tritici (strain CRL 75-36-700-3 / race SCCL) TaxID=418459 RepID=H6QPM0_PUCGT|nr:uncharacterized protein PGTG_20793 [Puccinia graminis f. sp. tritici CRL 75-36-700-3]EHS64090.1 hypothetical protein PGTG_20793 [Puccinia graminis f. sp. tritici CRL 75-36-700-3]
MESSEQQDKSDLNALENQGQVNRTHHTGRSSAESITHSFPKSQEQIIIGETEKPISDSRDVENDNTSEKSQNDARTGKQPPQWWPSLIKWNMRESTGRYKRMAIHLFFVSILLGWWISGLVLKETRHKWVITTFWTWLILLIIFFRWVPTKYVTRPIGKTYMTLIGNPIMKSTNHRVRLSIGWLILLGLWLGSTFGIKLAQGSNYTGRLRSLVGVIVFQLGFWASSRTKSLIRWRTIIVGLILQQLLALVVLKSKAGYDFFNWIAKAATDLLDQGTKAGGFFFSSQVLEYHWYFVNTLAAIIFFIALVQLLYYFGVMQAIMIKFAWVFYTLMGVSGVEALTAAASPFIGQGGSFVLIRPFAAQMTAAEIHQVMTSGFSAISGAVLTAYVAMGIPAVYLINASTMSIPASLAISKLRFPEDSQPLTAGKVIIPEDEHTNRKDSNAIMVFSDGAWLGLRVAGTILANLLTILALSYTVDGLLTWIGQFWGMDPNGAHPLTLELIFQYLLYPAAWLMGTPNQDVLKVSRLLAIKLITNEYVAYRELSKLQPEMTEKGTLIAIYSLCGFANLGSLGIQIGVLNSLVPSKKHVISRVAISALLCGFFSTIQTAAIAGMIF